MNDKLKIKGILELRFYKNGVLVKTDKDHNLITSEGYDSLLRSISGEVNYHIDKVQIGANSASPKSTDTAITSPIDLVVTSKTVSNGVLKLDFSIGSMTANGVTISEFGLITKNGLLFSRRTVAPFLKYQDLTVECTWTINI